MISWSVYLSKLVSYGVHHLRSVLGKVSFVEVFKMSRFNHARAVTIVLSLTRQENKSMITYAKVNDTRIL